MPRDYCRQDALIIFLISIHINSTNALIYPLTVKLICIFNILTSARVASFWGQATHPGVIPDHSRPYIGLCILVEFLEFRDFSRAYIGPSILVEFLEFRAILVEFCDLRPIPGLITCRVVCMPAFNEEGRPVETWRPFLNDIGLCLLCAFCGWFAGLLIGILTLFAGLLSGLLLRLICGRLSFFSRASLRCLI